MLADQGLCSVHASIAAFLSLIGLRFGELGARLKRFFTLFINALVALRVLRVRGEKLLLAKAGALSSYWFV